MSKTPEEITEEYAAKEGKPWGCERHFLAGYKAAQEHAHAALEEAEARMQELRDQVAGVSKVMNSPEDPDTCEHILDMEKMVDVNGWISVKDRLPERRKGVLFIHRSYGHNIGFYDSEGRGPGYEWFSMEWIDVPSSGVTHWMPLPAAPEEEE
jgi:hypothetical protein